MSVNLGGNIGAIYLGNDNIAKAYLGYDLVFSSTPPVPPEFFPDYIANGEDNTSGTSRNVYFNTGVVPTRNMCMRVTASNINFSPNKNQTIIGATDARAANHFEFFLPRNSTQHICYMRYNAMAQYVCQSSSANYSVPDFIFAATMWCDATANTMTLDTGTEVITASGGILYNAPSYSLFLFGRDLVGSVDANTLCYGGAKIYDIQLFDSYGGNLLYHFVPCVKDGVPCFKELVNGTYHYNLGNDEATYGYAQDIHLNYIGNGSDSTQQADVWFDTEVVPYKRGVIRAWYSTSQFTSTQTIVGVSDSTVSPGYHFLLQAPRDDEKLAGYHTTAFSHCKDTGSTYAVAGTVYDVRIYNAITNRYNNSYHLMIAGESGGTSTTISQRFLTTSELTFFNRITPVKPLYLFGNNNVGLVGVPVDTLCYGGTKIYQLQVYSTTAYESLVADFQPVLHLGVPCFKDVLSGKYIYNKGSGRVTYG